MDCLDVGQRRLPGCAASGVVGIRPPALQRLSTLYFFSTFYFSPPPVFVRLPGRRDDWRTSPR
jgi:hypothetical protein